MTRSFRPAAIGPRRIRHSHDGIGRTIRLPLMDITRLADRKPGLKLRFRAAPGATTAAGATSFALQDALVRSRSVADRPHCPAGTMR